MSTYENHREAVRARVIAACAELTQNEKLLLIIHVKDAGKLISGKRGINNIGYQVEQYHLVQDEIETTVDAATLVHAVNEFAKHEAFLEIPLRGVISTKPVDLGVATFQFTGSGAVEPYAYVGFKTMHDAELFRLGEYGHLTMPMPADPE